MDRKKLVHQSMDYIMQHLDKELSLDILADQFYISKYHFSRLFKEETGESIYAFMKRCKLDQSAIDMKLKPTKTITAIGLDYGYSASNYSSVFKKQHHTSPIMFRQSMTNDCIRVPFRPERSVHLLSAEEYASHIEIQELQDVTVLYERFIGSYNDIENHWYQFLNSYQIYQTEETILLERFFNDPSITNTSQCICDICMSVNQACKLNTITQIKGGKFIVYHYDGKIYDIYEVVQGIFRVWMPQSGYTMTQRYGLHIYRHIDPDQHRVKMDVCIPIS